ncbi:hypothetical protein Pint_12103 [Pistacia integerrima]|uniref:Uncharacterized protein n=1 Tax=Pistacia integerrima TaxID=434235 RepID=A0ACC0XL96_9ROSI|nr:hypothetical protein Pint_12103 [Pistacia integerrima]
MYAEEFMAERDVNSIHDPERQESHSIEIEIAVDPINNGSQMPNNQVQNGTSNESTQETSSSENRKVSAPKSAVLYGAALKGDWAAGKDLLGQDRSLLRGEIAKNGETVLHIAAGAKQIGFVGKLLEWMEPKDLTLEDRNGNSAFCFAVAAGAIEIAENMLKKNKELLATRGGENMTPIYLAAIFGYGDMALYLYREINKMKVILPVEDKASLLFACLYTALYDLAMDLLNDLPDLAMARDENKDTALQILARQPSSFAGRKGGLLKRLISSFPGGKNNHKTDSASTKALELVGCLLDILSEKGELEDPNLNFMFDAAKWGNFEFLNMFISRYPNLVDKVYENQYSIFHIAVIHRHADIFNLIFGIVDLKREVMTTLVDKHGNNILHLAAKLPHPSRFGIVSGVALQMQRELLWFKEIEKVVKPFYRKKKNSSGQTPQELFTKKHKRLLRDGESWMKKTASSCMLVATIVTSVIFAAAFSVPGGYEDKTGIPNLLKDNLFQVFSISNAIALSSSIISVLMFLSILTSRYTEDDFLRSLPLKLIGGLLSLYVSLVTMMIAFITSFLLSYHDRLNFATITIILMSVAATLFVLLQYPLLRDTFYSTYNSRFLFKSSTAML